MQNQNNGVFVISLDAIDLNLLPTIYNEKPDKISPLWTRSNLQMRNNDYYQFEIKCKDCEGSNKDKPSKQEYKNKVCHICDIEVPRPFWSHHRKSVRHKSNVKIADIAIQRMKKYLNEADHESDDEIHPSAHFCPTCVTVIDSEDINIHEKSPSHINGHIVEKLLNDFLVIYNFNETNTDVPNEQVVSNINEVENNIANNLGNKINKNKIANVKPINKIDTDPTLNNAVNPIDKDIINTNVFNLNAYIDLLNKSCNDIPMFFKVVNENLIEIEAIDGSIVRVTDRNFHGFNNVTRKHMQCLLCKLNFKAKKVDAHTMSTKHIANVILPLKDKHCLRSIDNDYYHCVICNTIPENSDLHLLCNENHEKLLKVALISDKLDENNIPTNYNLTKQSQTHKDVSIFEKVNDSQQSANKNMTSYADILQTYKKSIPHNHTINATTKEVYDQTVLNENEFKKETVLHKEGNTPDTLSKPLPVTLGYIDKVKCPKDRTFCEFCKKFISNKHFTRHKLRPKHILNTIVEPLYLMSEIDSINLLCKICHIRIINNAENVRQHYLDDGHKLKYKNLLAYNSISTIDQYRFYCQLCEEYLIIGNEIIHIDTKSHRFKCDTTEMVKFSHNEQENIKDVEKNKDEQKNHAIGGESNKTEQKNHNNEQENHAIDGEKNGTETNNEAEISRTLFEFYQCAVCDVKVPNYANNIQEHLNGRVHLRNLEKYSFDSNKTQEEKTVGNYHYHMELSEFPNCLNCIICNINIPYNEDYLTQHLNDLKHTINYEILLGNNFLVNQADKIYCELCTVDVGGKGELLHIKGRKHKKNIEKHKQTNNTSSVTSEINQIENISAQTDEIYYPSEDLIRRATARNIAPEMIIFLKETHDNSVECVVCKVNIPFTEYNVRTHMNGNRHAKNKNPGSTEDVNK